VIFPTPEVADKARAQLRCQRLIRHHNHIVEADRKKHDLLALSLFFEAFGDLILHPIAFDGMRGQDQQDFISRLDGDIDLVDDFQPVLRHDPLPVGTP
jgi:hypothetical protein